MAQFEPRLPEIKAVGAQVAFIAAEKRDGLWKPGKFLEKHPIASVFLLDEERTATRDYGLHHALGTDAINIAHSATLLIDRDRWVRYIYRGDNQRDRAPLDEVVGALRQIAK
jgi:peroxiredoxin